MRGAAAGELTQQEREGEEREREREGERIGLGKTQQEGRASEGKVRQSEKDSAR